MYCVFLCHLNCTIITLFFWTALYLTPWQFSPCDFKTDTRFYSLFHSFSDNITFQNCNENDYVYAWISNCTPEDKNQSHSCHWQFFLESQGLGAVSSLWPCACSPRGMLTIAMGEPRTWQFLSWFETWRETSFFSAVLFPTPSFIFATWHRTELKHHSSLCCSCSTYTA